MWRTRTARRQRRREHGNLKVIAASMPLSMFNLVQSTHTAVLLSGNELRQGPFQKDAYLSTHRPKACLAVPILQQNKLTGLLYLQNDHTADSFTRTHLQILTVLTQQAALSIENARLYARLQQRTQELQSNNEQLQNEVVQRQAAQDAMRVAKEAAEKAAETKSSFLSNMSHEIRTPMNAVLGASRLLLDTDLTQEQSSYLTMITNSGKLLLTIINDVLDFSRIESNNLELEYRRFSLMECVENACHLCFDMAAKKQLDLAYTVDRHVPGYIYGDSSRLQQILLNLLSNACKFTQPGGQVVVTVSCRIVDPSTPAAEMLARAAAAHSLTHGHSPPQGGSNSRDGRVSVAASTNNKQRVPSATAQHQPSRRLAGSSAVQTSSSSSSVVSTVRGLVQRAPSQTHSANSSPTVATPNSAIHTPPPRHFIELHFSVRDTGLGMSEETQSRLFKSFSQGDSSVVRRFGGTGLGLAISKRLALAMHGEMWCESQVGDGSTFYFTIQTACATPAVSRRTVQSGGGMSTNAHTAQSIAAEPSPLGLSPLSRLGPSYIATAAGGAIVSSVSPRGDYSQSLIGGLTVKQHSLHRLSDVEVQRLQGKRVLLVSDLPASRSALENLLDSFDMSVTALTSLQQAAEHAASFGITPMYHAVILDYKGCNSSPQHVQLVDSLINAFVTSAHAAANCAGTTADTIHTVHPAVLMLTTRLAGGSLEGSGAGLEIVKPSAVVGGKEGDDCSEEEETQAKQQVTPTAGQTQHTHTMDSSEAREDEVNDERTGEGSEHSLSTDEDDEQTAVSASGQQDNSAHALGTSHALVGQLVLAKLNSEQHKQHSFELHKQQRREERKRRIRISKADKLARTADVSDVPLRQPKPTHLAAADESNHLLSPATLPSPTAPLPPPTASTFMYPSASPSPPPSATSFASPRSPSRSVLASSLPAFSSSSSSSSSSPHDPPVSAVLFGSGSGEYCLLELPRPYRQDDLLSTLVEHMPAGDGEVLPEGGRWAARSVSAVSAVSANGSEEVNESNSGSQHGDEDTHSQHSEPVQQQSAYNAVYAQRKANHRISSGSGSDSGSSAVESVVAGGSDRSRSVVSPSHSSANALFGIPSVGSSLRKEIHSSRAMPHRSSRHTDSDRPSRSTPQHQHTQSAVRAEERSSAPTQLTANGVGESTSKLAAATPPSALPAAVISSTSPNQPRSTVLPASINASAMQSPSTVFRTLMKNSSRATPSRQTIQSIAATCPLSMLLAEDNPGRQHYTTHHTTLSSSPPHSQSHLRCVLSVCHPCSESEDDEGVRRLTHCSAVRRSSALYVRNVVL